jgi:DNA-binding transcriptional regulator of glucitol operon
MMDNQLGTIIIIFLVITWVIQLWMSNRQLRRFYKRLKELRKDGLTAVGLDGNRLSGRLYGVLTVNPETRMIVHAEKFGGSTVFANLKPFPLLENKPLADLLDGKLDQGVPKKLLSAFMNAGRDIQKELDKPNSTEDAAADEQAEGRALGEGMPA